MMILKQSSDPRDAAPPGSSTRCLMLVGLPHAHHAEFVADALAA
jgi:hypothetical protein